MSLLNCLGGECRNTSLVNSFYVFHCFRDLKLEPYVDHYYRDYPTLVRTTGQVCAIDQGKCSAVKDSLNSMLTFACIFLGKEQRRYFLVLTSKSGVVFFHQADFSL